MHITKTKQGTIVELDIHGMYAEDAKRRIERYLSAADPKVKEVIVIHGYHQGRVLQHMVRTQLKHRRIASKVISLNEGQTRLILKTEI